MNARLHKLLAYYDEPQLALFIKDGYHNLMAVAIERDDMDFPFFACVISPRNLKRYMDMEVDLYFLFKEATSFYFFDWGRMNDKNEVNLSVVSPEEISNRSYWPERGFFSSSHSEIDSEVDNKKSYVGIVEQTFNIDGKWVACDFSRFYNKLSDFYAIYSAVTDPTNSKGYEFLARAIGDRPWRGGGSYRGFYNVCISHNSSMTPLTMKSISYASPGKIVLKGDKAIFAAMLSSINNFNNSSLEAKKAYGFVDKTLNLEKLKRDDPNGEFSSDTMAIYVKDCSDDLLDYLHFPGKEILFKSCESNVLIYAKIVLSIFRRMKEVNSFFIEGRVAV